MAGAVVLVSGAVADPWRRQRLSPTIAHNIPARLRDYLAIKLRHAEQRFVWQYAPTLTLKVSVSLVPEFVTCLTVTQLTNCHGACRVAPLMKQHKRCSVDERRHQGSEKEIERRNSGLSKSRGEDRLTRRIWRVGYYG
jgi:hypothetical protein